MRGSRFEWGDMRSVRRTAAPPEANFLFERAGLGMLSLGAEALARPDLSRRVGTLLRSKRSARDADDVSAERVFARLRGFGRCLESVLIGKV